jgi:Pyruvate/2-oxoacid:ferredoxin oxidoreductase delta subunit
MRQMQDNQGMRNRVWELSLEERRKPQDGRVREMIIGAYAPHEPKVMDAILHFLKYEKKIPLALTHKIADRLASMTVCTTVVTHAEIMDFIKGIPDDFGIVCGPCACRLNTAEKLGPDGRDLSAGKLDLHRQTPLNVDIQIAKCAEKFGKLKSYSPITKAELLALEEECFNLGLVANVYVIMGGDAGICHCSSATCAPFLANEALGGASTVIKKGAFMPRTDGAACDGTGDCLKVCHFHARKIVEREGKAISTIAPAECYGCGICAAVCQRKAISMVPRRAQPAEIISPGK